MTTNKQTTTQNHTNGFHSGDFKHLNEWLSSFHVGLFLLLFFFTSSHVHIHFEIIDCLLRLLHFNT